jgi:predicted MFS family arabinose efflux permease
MTATTTTEPARFRDALRHREFRLLLASYAVSWTGDWCFSVALTIWVVQRTGSGTWVAVLLVIRIVPYVLFGAVGGVIADRRDRRRLMVGLDLGRAVLMVPLILVVAADGPVVIAAVVTFCAGSMSAVYRPAVVASTPNVVGEADLAPANALESILNQVTLFIGPALASLLLEISSAEVAFVFNAVTFLVSAVLVAGVRAAGGRPRSADDTGADEEPASGVRADFVEGVRALRRIPGLVVYTVLLVGSILAYGAEEVLKVLVTTDNLGTGPEALGLLAAAMGVGGLVVAPFTARLMARSHLATLFVASLVITGVTNAALALPRSMAPALVILFVEGIALIVYEVAAITLLQRAVPSGLLGRVSGLQDSLCTAGMVIGTIAAPAAVALVGLDAALVILGAGLVAGSLLALPALRPLDRLAAVRADDTAPTVAVLATLPIFSGAPRAALERIAAATREQVVPSGVEVVVEGDPADDLFVVRAGRLDVVDTDGGRAAPTTINEMGPDDVFGEIGLVQRRPRTATVVTTVETTLWRIPGDVFLDAVIGRGAVSPALASTIGTHLERTASHRGVRGTPP